MLTTPPLWLKIMQRVLLVPWSMVAIYFIFMSFADFKFDWLGFF
jgi:hypothetical protein